MDRRQFVRQGTIALFWGLAGLFSPFGSRALGETPHLSGRKPRIALIIDDIGFNRGRARAFLDIGVPMTYAVLPRLRLTACLAEEIHRYGRQVMLHQPMEPFDPAIDPGPGAVFVSDTPEKIAATIRSNLEETPFAAGMNNHMGSRFTSSPEKMAQALPVVRDEGLFFVDSLTTGRSKAYPTACRLHMPAAYRNIFIDNQPEESLVLRRMNQLFDHARRYGQAIGIGHPHQETYKAVARFVSSTSPDDVEFVHVSSIL